MTLRHRAPQRPHESNTTIRADRAALNHDLLWIVCDKGNLRAATSVGDQEPMPSGSAALKSLEAFQRLSVEPRTVYSRLMHQISMDESSGKMIARKFLGGSLIFAGVSHLTFARDEFKAQVPNWVPQLSPFGKDDTVVLSGIAEIALGTALLLVGPKHSTAVGRIAAAFFTAVFPGNLSQFLNRRNAFGLNTDNKRFIRLFFQPLLVYWALKSE